MNLLCKKDELIIGSPFLAGEKTQVCCPSLLKDSGRK